MNRQQRRANERKKFDDDTEFVYYGENNNVLFSGTEKEMIEKHKKSRKKQEFFDLQVGCEYDLDLLKIIGSTKELIHLVETEKIYSDELGFKFFNNYPFDITADIFYYIDEADILKIQASFLEPFAFENKNTNEHNKIIKDLGCNKFNLKGAFNLYQKGLSDVSIYIIVMSDHYILCFEHELIFSGSEEEARLFIKRSENKRFRHNNHLYVKAK